MRLPKTAAPFRQFFIKKSDSDSLKGFPKGACFALSGVFFLLTFVVLFQSKEPFGIAAIVAYITSLFLTILLFSAPYFAAYFISYHRKLHQIEKAIVLLSEQKPNSGSVTLDVPSPYSAVSLVMENDDIDGRISTENDGDDRDVNGPALITSSQMVSSDGDGYASQSESAVEESAPKKKPRKKPTTVDLRSNDEYQMSLFDPRSENEEASETVPAETEQALAEVIPTEIHAYMLLDTGHSLFVRGDPPYSWDKGEELTLLEVGKYWTTPFSIDAAIEVTFLINDNPKQMSERFRIEPSISNECYPDI